MMEKAALVVFLISISICMTVDAGQIGQIGPVGRIPPIFQKTFAKGIK